MSERPKADAWKAVTTGLLIVAFVVFWPLSLLWRGAGFVPSRWVGVTAQAIASADPTLDADGVQVGLWFWSFLVLPVIV